jgi:hydroxyacylglutathione hydrolase
VLQEWQTGGGPLGTIEELEAEPLAVRVAAWKTIVVDLREPHAFRLAHIPEALNLPLKNFRFSVAGLPHQTSLTVVCETGDRSSFAASLLWNMNYHNVAILRGGFRRYLEAGLPVIRR